MEKYSFVYSQISIGYCLFGICQAIFSVPLSRIFKMFLYVLNYAEIKFINILIFRLVGVRLVVAFPVF